MPDARHQARSDAAQMAHALRLGRRGLGHVWPNPAVGCVILGADGRVVGRGATAPGGRPHAETQALAQAGEAAGGGTAYVSLEPCAHHGRTPPCAEALVKAGIARVVTALTDPDPRVAGRGHAMLRDAGIEVVTGIGAQQAARDQRGFLSRVRLGRPMVTLKLAMSVDGRIATPTGESQWITGPRARARGHLMRATHDAVLVGSGTVHADDPALTVRGLGIARQPVRVVADSRLSIPPKARLFADIDRAPVWLCHTAAAPAEVRKQLVARGAVCIECAADRSGRIDMADMLQRLGARGLTRVYCEGGGGVAASLLRGGLVDEMAVFTAGLAIGSDGLAGIGPLALPTLAEAQRFRLHGVEMLGPDLLSLWILPPEIPPENPAGDMPA